MTGAYAAYKPAEILGKRGIGDRIALARRGGALIHEEVADEELLPTRKAVTVAWHKVPYQAGGWCHWDPDRSSHGEAFQRLHDPDGRFIVIGDQVSDWPGWQEGCLQSVERALAHLQGLRAEPVGPVPDSRWLTGGDHPWGGAEPVL